MRSRKTLIITALIGLGCVATAGAAVRLYDNNLERKAQYREIDKLGFGKSCERSYRKSGSLGVEVRRGRTKCLLSTPVFGDRPQANHEIKVKAALSKATPKSIARSGYVGVRLRASKSKGYEFRLYTSAQRWKLVRYPKGSGFPVSGTNKGAINKFPRTNTISLRVVDGTLNAKINKSRVVKKLVDTNKLSEVSGNATALVFGSDQKTKKNTSGYFDNIRVGVANP